MTRSGRPAHVKQEVSTLPASEMTPRERFIAALERRALTGRVPHFELVFFLTMEAFGQVHPSQRHYGQWDQMEEKERELHRDDMADLYVAHRRALRAQRHLPAPEPEHVRGDRSPHPQGAREVGRPLLPHAPRRRDLRRPGRRPHDAVRRAHRRRAGEAEGPGGIDGGRRRSSAPRSFKEARRAGRLRPLLGLLLQRRPVPEPAPVRRVRHALPGAPDRRLPRHGLLRHQAHRRQHHAHHRPARATRTPTPSTRSTRRAAWTSPRSSAATATASA